MLPKLQILPMVVLFPTSGPLAKAHGVLIARAVFRAALTTKAPGFQPGPRAMCIAAYAEKPTHLQTCRGYLSCTVACHHDE